MAPIQHPMELTGIAPNLGWTVIAGGAAGALTVTGIKADDHLLAVINLAAAGPNLVSEFAVTADDTIDNTGGTNTTGMTLLVVHAVRSGGVQ